MANSGTRQRLLIEKAVVYPHRSYRKLAHEKNSHLVIEFLVMSLPFVTGIYLLLPVLTKLMAANAILVLKTLFGVDGAEASSREFLGTTIWVLSAPGRYPSLQFALGNAAAAFIVCALFPIIPKVPRPLGLAVAYAAFIHLVTAAFFIIFPGRFPYNAGLFTEMYVRTAIGMWFMIPIMAAGALLPLPAPLSSKTGLVLKMILLDAALNALRLAVFMFILKSWSYVFMTIMFFILGPLADFFIVVVLYSNYVAGLSTRFQKESAAWKWSF